MQFFNHFKIVATQLFARHKRSGGNNALAYCCGCGISSSGPPGSPGKDGKDGADGEAGAPGKNSLDAEMTTPAMRVCLV